jgi:glycosyltransferase involved in cell wall biosynthesis
VLEEVDSTILEKMTKTRHALYIPFAQYQSLGGPATFMQNLQRYLEQQNFACLPSLNHAKGVFFPTSFPLKKLKKIKQQSGYVIQRLDGIYYPSKHGEHYADLNKDVKEIYLHYADMVIFQSRYSRAQCFAMFGEREGYTIILNGADKSIFYPSQTRKDAILKEKIRFVTTGRFRNVDMIEPVVQALDMLKASFDFELVVIGPVVNPELELFLRRDYLAHIETLTLPEIAEELRKSDIFVYSHLNPPCPNAVVEAISCGVPVVGFDSGAMAELCFFSKELLAPVSHKVFQQYEDFDAHKLAEKILLAVQHYEHYQEMALSHSHLYSFEECGQQYLDLFQSYVKKRRTFVLYMRYRFKHIMNKIQHLPSHLRDRQE